ncbi:MAG: zinc-binding dehydrogenase [Chloroflexi bacterium]|nr:zinc-binding dehydrogenase [Chloroflexota bacterium]
MREFILTAPHTLEFRDVTPAPLQPDEVRIRTILSGIKHGTELTMYEGKTPFLHKRFDADLRLFVDDDNPSFYPTFLGSWAVGDVTEVGAVIHNFAVGDRVFGPMPHRPENVTKTTRLYPLGELDPAAAVFTDPGIFALTAVQDAQIKVGDHVAVFGMGALGLLAVQLARLSGAETVIAVDLLPDRLELAREFGADYALSPKDGDVALEIKRLTGNKGVDAAIEISGAVAALQSAIRAVHVCGLIVAASYYKGLQPIELGAEWHHNRPTLISSMPVWGMPHRCAPMWSLARVEQTVIRLLRTGKLATAPMVSTIFAYEDAVDAYRTISANPEQYIKTVFEYT